MIGEFQPPGSGSARRLSSRLLRLFVIAFLVLAPVETRARAQVPGSAVLSPTSGRVILSLDDPPLALAPLNRVLGRGPERLHSAQALGHLAHLAEAQSQLAARLMQEFPEAVVEYSYRVTFNGLAVRLRELTPAIVQTLRSLPGVKAVYEDIAFSPALYASLPAIRAQELWTELGGATHAGQGVKIAILDSGIDTTHPMFSGDGFSYPSGFPKGDARYTSPKVIAARAYVRPTDLPMAGEDSPLPGIFGSGHGTHVAGIAAGNTIVAEIQGLAQEISGVAPKAWLMNYRVFYPTDSSGLEVAYSAEILRAIEDAVNDGADVICNSWSNSSASLPFASPEAEALNAAIEAGCVVVAPAGNDGPGYGSASRVPGGIERVITVGAVSKDQVIASDLLDVTGPQPVGAQLQNLPFARALFGGSIEHRVGPLSYLDVNDADPNDSSLACNPLTSGALTGKIALISRGECNFADKAYYAQQAGARAVVICNTDDELFSFGCGGEHCNPGEIIIPVVMVTQSSGRALLDWLRDHPSAKLQLDPNGRIVSAQANIVQPSSGRGPAFGRYLKPDVVAPGVQVLSAYHERGSAAATYAQLSGGSMACAHVAGAAALLLQAHPSWNHDTIKAALIATARASDLVTGEPLTAADVLDRGGGLIDVAAAAKARLAFSPPSLAFPHLLWGERLTAEVRVTDLRSEGGTQTWQLSAQCGSGLSVTVPTQVVASPGRVVTFEVGISALTTGSVEDAWAELRLQNGSDELRIPIWAHSDPSAESGEVLVIDNDFSQFESYVDYAGHITRTLASLGLSYEVWDADTRFGNAQTIPSLDYLQRFRSLIWVTGDNVHPDGYYAISTPLTLLDMQILASYLDAGGRLVAWGQNLAEASDVNSDPDPNWGRAAFYHYYLGVHWLQGSLFGPASVAPQPPSQRAGAVGVPGTFLSGMTLDLGPVGSGAHNQRSIDEIAPGGLPDGSDGAWVQPILVALEALPIGSGFVAVAKSDEPTLDSEAVRVPYRSVYYSFGFEGINDNAGRTSRAQLLKRTLDWLVDEVGVTLDDVIGSVNDPIHLSCQARSSVTATITSYRWRIGEGDDAQTVVGQSPEATFFFPRRGRVPVAVEVTDSLGHKAVAHAEVLIVEGGSSSLTCDASTANVGQVLNYQVLAFNTGANAMAMSFSLPLPAGTDYVSHTGGSFTGGALRWSGTLAAGTGFGATLQVRIRSDIPSGNDVVATVEFHAGQDTFSKEVRTRVNPRIYLPFLQKP